MQQNGDGYMDFYLIILRPLLLEIPQKRKKKNRSVFIWRHILKKGNMGGYTQLIS